MTKNLIVFKALSPCNFVIAEAKKIPYVDVFSPLKRAVCDGGWKSVYCYDHFHPNEGGYKIMAEVIADNLIGER